MVAFDVFVVKDPTSTLPEEVKIIMDEKLLAFVAGTAVSPDVAHSFLWGADVDVVHLPGSGDPEDMDDIQITVPGSMYLFECEDASPIIAQAQIFSKAKSEGAPDTGEGATILEPEENTADEKGTTEPNLTGDETDGGADADADSDVENDKEKGKEKSHMKTCKRRRKEKQEWKEGLQARIELLGNLNKKRRGNAADWKAGMSSRLKAVQAGLIDEEGGDGKNKSEEEEEFHVDDRVEVKVEGEEDKVQGYISRMHSDGTYKVECDNGNELRYVDKSRIRHVEEEEEDESNAFYHCKNTRVKIKDTRTKLDGAYVWLVEATTDLAPGEVYAVRFKDGHIQELAGNNLTFYKRCTTVSSHFKKKLRKGSMFIRGKKGLAVGYDSDEDKNEEMRERLQRQQEKAERTRQKAFKRYAKKSTVPRRLKAPFAQISLMTSMWFPQHGHYKIPQSVDLAKPEKLDGSNSYMFSLQLKMYEQDKRGRKIRFERDKYFDNFKALWLQIPKIEREELKLGPFPAMSCRDAIKRQVILRDLIRQLHKRIKRMPKIDTADDAIVNLDGTIDGFGEKLDSSKVKKEIGEEEEEDSEDDEEVEGEAKKKAEEDKNKPKVTDLSVGSVSAVLCFFHQAEIPRGLVKSINQAYEKLPDSLKDCAYAYKECSEARMSALILIEQAKACTCAIVQGRLNKCMSCRVAENKLGQGVSVFLSEKDIGAVTIGKEEYTNKEPTKALRSIRKKLKVVVKRHAKYAQKVEALAIKSCMYRRKSGECPIAARNGLWMHHGHEFTCVCCLEQFKGEQMVVTLKCKHMFHANCISDFTSNCYNFCPICNDPFTTEPSLFAEVEEEEEDEDDEDEDADDDADEEGESELEALKLLQQGGSGTS